MAEVTGIHRRRLYEFLAELPISGVERVPGRREFGLTERGAWELICLAQLYQQGVRPSSLRCWALSLPRCPVGRRGWLVAAPRGLKVRWNLDGPFARHVMLDLDEARQTLERLLRGGE